MSEIKKSRKDVLYKTGQLDCLSYYNCIFKKKSAFLKKFLGGREIATKIYLPEYQEGDFIVKRGSKETPLYISELLKNDRKKFMSLRKADDLKDVRDRLNSRQEKIWHYFVPRKKVEMHYALNKEKGRDIDRILIDIDHGGGYSEEDARKVVFRLRKEIKNDNELKEILNKNKQKERKIKTQVLWTGSGFHIYIMLPDKKKSSFYKKHFSWGKKTRKTFIEKWAEAVSKSTGFKIEAGHERKKNKIVLDTSGTPPGKLARCPYSLNLNSEGELEGICVPLEDKGIEDPKIVKKLRKLTPKIISDY